MAKNLIPEFLEQSSYASLCLQKLEFPFGNFFIFEKFVVGEVAEGVHFNWSKAQLVIDGVYDFFGTSDINVAYISNRVNSYSVQPKDWMEFYKERHKLSSLAVVGYNERGLMSVILENIFTVNSIKKFNSLEAAIQWITSDMLKMTD